LRELTLNMQSKRNFRPYSWAEIEPEWYRWRWWWRRWSASIQFKML